eukprot:7757190-Pyramimonas_sp.AAC.1
MRVKWNFRLSVHISALCGHLAQPCNVQLTSFTPTQIAASEMSGKRALPAAAETAKRSKPSSGGSPATKCTDQSISSDVALSGDVNKAYTAKFEPMLSKVIHAFDDIQRKSPISIEAGGTMDPITQSSVALAMSTERGVVSGAGNLFWHNIRWRPSPNVPINETGITEIKLHSFKTPPAKLNFNLHVAFANDMEFTGALGNLHRLSPEEPVHAL